MNLPGEDVEEFTDNDDVGYRIKVLIGSKENEYKAVCDALGQTVVFYAEYAVYEDGTRVRPFLTEDEEVGGNCRGYAGFSIVERDGREYLQATEYLYGEAGLVQCVGYATFLIDWEEGGTVGAGIRCREGGLMYRDSFYIPVIISEINPSSRWVSLLPDR